MARPRPVPPYFRVVEVSAWVKAWNKPADLLRGHADAGVPDGELQGDPVLVPGDHLRGDDDFAGVGELDGVVGQVDQHLPQAQGVAHQGPGHLRGQGKQHFQALFPGLHRDQGGQVVQHLLQVEVHLFHGQLAGLDLGEIQDVVDDAQQVVSRGLHLGDVVALLGVQVGLQGQVAHADDGVHGGADLVAHVGQEIALGPGGGLGGGPGLLELPFGPVPVQGDGDGLGDAPQGLHRLGDELGPGKEGHDPHHPALHHQGMAHKTHQAVTPHPFLVIDVGLRRDIVGETELGLPGDAADLVLPQGDAAAQAVDVGVQPGAGLHLQDVVLGVQGPDAGQGGIQMLHQGLGAQLQPLPQRLHAGEGVAHVRAQNGQVFPLLGGGDVPAGADDAAGPALVVPQDRGPGRQDPQAGVRPDDPEFQIIIRRAGDRLAGGLFDPGHVVGMDPLQKDAAVVVQGLPR